MSCLQNVCSWLLVIGLCSAQISVDEFSPEGSDDVISIETVTSINIDTATECGGEYTQNSGRISSPGYPYQNYSFNGNCTWSIKVDKGKALMMYFEYIDMEIGPPDCLFDGVIVVDDLDSDQTPFTPGSDPFGESWNHAKPQVIGKFCGSESFKPFVSVTNSVRVRFYSDTSNEYGGFVLTWTTVDAKPRVHQSCDFEDGLCEGWKNNITADNFDWTIFSGNTPSKSTGPDFDHTKQNGDGFYAYIESSQPRVKNDIALLLSPEIKFREKDSDYCLDFWYHMHGRSAGSLVVALLIEKVQERKWIRSGNQGNQWNHESITINKVESPFEIIFAGVVGSGYEGDIAIDDIKLYGEPCSEITWEDRKPRLDEEIGLYIAPCEEENEFRCKNTSTCISQQKVCDGIVDCQQMDDEDFDNCRNTSDIPPPIEVTSESIVEETTEGIIIEESAKEYSTYAWDTTPNFVDITTNDGQELTEESTAALPRETTQVNIFTTGVMDTTMSTSDPTTQYTDTVDEDTTTVPPRETTHVVMPTSTTTSSLVTTISDITTDEDDFTTSEIDTTHVDTSPFTTDSDDVTTGSASVTTSTVTLTTRTADAVNAQDEQTAWKTQPGMVSTASARSRTESSLKTSSKTKQAVIATTGFSNGDVNLESDTRDSEKPMTTTETQKVEPDFTQTTPMVLLNKLEVSTRSSFVTPTPRSTTLKSELATTIAEASSPLFSDTSAVKTDKDTTQSHQQTAAILPKITETTTREHVVGNMEVPTMADKQKGDNGSSVTAPTSVCVMLIGMLLSLANALSQ